MTESLSSPTVLTRRDWLTYNAAAVAAVHLPRTARGQALCHVAQSSCASTDVRAQADKDVLVQRAVDAALRAGAQYADARVTRTVIHNYTFQGPSIGACVDTVGLGVRALVNGYWGFAATPSGDTAEADRLGQAATAQARTNARGTPRTVDLGHAARPVGAWTMPVKIDAFTVPIEEKLACMRYWMDYAEQVGYGIDPMQSSCYFVRQERTVATSDGARFTQTVYESGAVITVLGRGTGQVTLLGLTPAGKGWDLLLDADIPGQLRDIGPRFDAVQRAAQKSKPVPVGRYTLVCDGETMAAMLDRTIGMATQLDRALGYEANASGTSFLNDPLAMLGSFTVGSPVVSVTGNRSTPGQLATVRWDEEGVESHPFPIVQDGVLVDFQTTREQAAWLAPYYHRHNRPVQSHGCAGVEDALTIPLQHMPNLTLAPSTSATLDDLIASTTNGILMRAGRTNADMQGRTGELHGNLFEIRNGRIREAMTGGVVLYDALDFWRHVQAVGGPPSQGELAVSRHPYPTAYWQLTGQYPLKGQPPQFPSYSIQAPGALITGQAIVDPRRRA